MFSNMRALLAVVALKTSMVFAFTPSVTISCTPTAYTLTVSGTVSTGRMFIENTCNTLNTADTTTTYTMDATTCTSLPALDTAFIVVVLEYADYEQGSDYRLEATCTKDLADQTLSIAAGVTAGSTDASVTKQLAPEYTIALVESGGTTAVSSAIVGTAVDLKVTMDSVYTSDYGHQIKDITAGGLAVVSDGCGQYGFNDVLTVGSAEIVWDFELFLPLTTTSNTVTDQSVTFTVTVVSCDGTCTAFTCTGRKKRSAMEMWDEEKHLPLTVLKTSVHVYPRGYPINVTESLEMSLQGPCLPRTPIIATVIALSVALIVCLGISFLMFMKMRSARASFTTEEIKSYPLKM